VVVPEVELTPELDDEVLGVVVVVAAEEPLDVVVGVVVAVDAEDTLLVVLAVATDVACDADSVTPTSPAPRARATPATRPVVRRTRRRARSRRCGS
jgi:hypothetical protein